MDKKTKCDNYLNAYHNNTQKSSCKNCIHYSSRGCNHSNINLIANHFNF